MRCGGGVQRLVVLRLLNSPGGGSDAVSLVRIYDRQFYNLHRVW